MGGGKVYLSCFGFKGQIDYMEQKALENKEYIGDDILGKKLQEEVFKVNHMDYDLSQKYISQITRDIIYNKKDSQ